MTTATSSLMRSRDEKVVGGVCAGIADWLGWDATMVRIAYVILSLFSTGFPGLLVYIVLWLAMPERR